MCKRQVQRTIAQQQPEISYLTSATLYHKHSYSLTQTVHLGAMNETLSNSTCTATTASLVQCGGTPMNLCNSTNKSISLPKIQLRNVLESYKMITLKLQHTHTHTVRMRGWSAISGMQKYC